MSVYIGKEFDVATNKEYKKQDAAEAAAKKNSFAVFSENGEVLIIDLWKKNPKMSRIQSHRTIQRTQKAQKNRTPKQMCFLVCLRKDARGKLSGFSPAVSGCVTVRHGTTML